MRWFEQLTNAVKVRWILVFLLLFLSVNSGIYYFILHRFEKTTRNLKQTKNKMIETYTQLKSKNMNDLMKNLNTEVNYLKRKEESLFSHPLSNEQIPLFVSKLEREASRAGLEVKSSVEIDKNKKLETFKIVTTHLKFTGSFQEVLKFLRILHSWDEVVLIADFYIKKKMNPTVNCQVRQKLFH